MEQIWWVWKVCVVRMALQKAGSESRNVLRTMILQVWLTTKLGGGRLTLPSLLCTQGSFSLLMGHLSTSSTSASHPAIPLPDLS